MTRESTRQTTFRFLAGILALLMGLGAVLFLCMALLSDAMPWYVWMGKCIVLLVPAYGFGAYALDLPGPYNRRRPSK